MAVLINGARVDEQVYEFAVTKQGVLVECENYDIAKDVTLVDPKAKIKMRCVYKTEWMEAQ